MIISCGELDTIRQQETEATIALRFGSFDLLHAGHQEAIAFASSQADVLVVGVMSDDMVRRTKGQGRPINPEEDRVQAIDRAEGVDFSFVTSTGSLSVAGLFLRLRPDVYIEHEEYGMSRLRTLFLRTLGINYVIDQGPKVDSTTGMIERLGLSGAIEKSIQF